MKIGILCKNQKLYSHAHLSAEDVAREIEAAVTRHFAEIELDRLRRLADRVFAIQMAIEGADFLQVYGYFLERTDNPEQSFENVRRVFRGGVITGGARSVTGVCNPVTHVL